MFFIRFFWDIISIEYNMYDSDLCFDWTILKGYTSDAFPYQRILGLVWIVFFKIIFYFLEHKTRKYV